MYITMITNTSNNILQSIIDKKNLSGINLLDWHWDPGIVLKHDKNMYVLAIPLPEDEPPSSTATMNSELQNQHEKMEVFDMIEHTKDVVPGAG